MTPPRLPPLRVRADRIRRRGARLGAALLLLAAAVPARAGVEGTPHDMTAMTGDAFVSPCEYCHIPHQAQGERLWVSTPYGPETGWGSRPVAQLCYTCHDIMGGGFNATDVTATAYSERSHGYDITRMPPAPDGTFPPLPPLPYAEGPAIDCTTCHDPHATTPPFLRAGSIDELCKSCHGRGNPGLLAGANLHGSPEGGTFSLHPTDVEYVDLPENGPTSLRPLPPRFQQPTASGSWQLGAHRVGWLAESGAISCQTCHPVHGGSDYTLGVLPGPPASYLTPVENYGGIASALCQSCHQGGGEGEVGIGSDHPVNSNDGVPPTVFPVGWPAGPVGEVNCSSCHDAHGGEGASSLLRRGGNSVDGWCFSCHSVASLVPPYHHSSREIDDPSIFTSLLTCGDCHGTAAGWTAHNGFDGFKFEISSESSAHCEACHDPEDPPALREDAYLAATGLEKSFAGAEYPAAHGLALGTDSHMVNEADDDSIKNCQVRTEPWEESGGVSKYGPGGEILCESCHGLLANAGLLLGTEGEEALTGGWKANLLLAPFEGNSPGVGIEEPDFFPGPTSAALCRGCHYAVREGIDPTFVHNPPVHTQLDYRYEPRLTPYGRATDTLLTTPIDSAGESCPEVSTADQLTSPSGLGVASAPGVFAYPADNGMDCDSCHRPHGAHDDSSDDGIRRILTYTAAGAHGTAPCLECHDTEVMCGFPRPGQ